MDGKRTREHRVNRDVSGERSRRGSGERRGSAGRVRLLAALGLTLAASLCASAPAMAAGSSEHVYSFRFGSPGAGAGQFSHPSAIAVNTAGDVYVADRGNNRVEEFEPQLTGGEVTGEKPLAQFAAVPSPARIAVDDCTTGGHACSTTEDPSVGDVYVAGPKSAKGNQSEDTVLYKFSPTGTELGSIKAKGPIEGVAVDHAGTLFIYYEKEAPAIAEYSDAEPNVAVGKPLPTEIANIDPGLAVNSKDNLYVGSGLAQPSKEEGEEDLPLSNLLSELIKEYGQLFNTPEPVVAELEPGSGSVAVPALDYEPTTAVAVDAGAGVSGEGLDDVYAVNVEPVSGATLAIFGPESEPPLTGSNRVERHGKLIERLEAPGLEEADAVAVDATSGATSGAVYVAGGASDTIDVFTEPRAHPALSALAEHPSCTEDPTEPEDCPFSASAAKLEARVDPAGSATTYYFEYGTGSCSTPGSCSQTPHESAGSGFAAVPVEASVPGLAPGVYHYRAVAEGATVAHSEESTFTVVAQIGGLPDGRQWEMVTPPGKGGDTPLPIHREGGAIQAAANGSAITYIADGPMPAGQEPEGNRAFEPAQILSARGSTGWNSQDIITPNSTAAGGRPGSPPEYQLFSPNLTFALVMPIPGATGSLASPPLAPPVTKAEEEAVEHGESRQENTPYLRDDLPLEAERETEQTEAERAEAEQNFKKAQEDGEAMHKSSFLALVDEGNSPRLGTAFEPFGGEFAFIGESMVPAGASPDLTHVVLVSKRAAPGLYEWGGAEVEEDGSGVGRHLELVSEPSPGVRLPPSEATLGDPTGQVVRGAVSKDGSLVFWTRHAGGEDQLYVHDAETHSSLRLDAVQAGQEPVEVPNDKAAEAVFQTASADGRRVFFTDPQRLTTNSRAVPGAPDLYVFEFTMNPGEAPAGKLIDLTPQEGADVLVDGTSNGGVIGAGEDGSYVYFAADGVLSPNATRGGCSPKEAVLPAGTTCSIYMIHNNGHAWEGAKLVATVSSEDNPDWFQTTVHLATVTSRVSPNGEWLAFMSKRSLTGYDNEDISSKKPGERMDEEVYLYHSSDGSLVCASCDPTGARPRGVFDQGELGHRLYIDEREIWAEGHRPPGERDPWLAASLPGWTPISTAGTNYQSRYLSDKGRLFFNSADPLVPLAVPTREEEVKGEKLQVGVENVYEYEPVGEGSCVQAGGCVGLLSSGTSSSESAFLDASKNGNDVFIITAAPLVPQEDHDEAYDIYDAHLCEAASPCIAPPTPEAEGCTGALCNPYVPPPASSTPGTTAPGAGNSPKVEVLPEKVEVKPKPLTRAEKLAKALKACKKDKKKAKRQECEKQARQKYGPIKKPAAKKSSTGGKR